MVAGLLTKDDDVSNRPALKNYLTFFVATIFLSSSIAVAYADELSPQDQSYIPINLSFPKDQKPLEIKISREQATAYHWKAGQTIRIRAFVEKKGGAKQFVHDQTGHAVWPLVLDKNLEGSLAILPGKSSFSGRLTILGDKKILSANTPYLGEALGNTLEKIQECRFSNGVSIKVHYTDQLLEEGGASEEFPRDVLDSAVMAYQTITQFEGFNSLGYSFAEPDKNYVYDPDKTIDIYLGLPASENSFKYHGFTNQSYKDAPCFDTIKLSDTSYQAVILLPVNYHDFIKNWEKLNPSSLGKRNINIDLRGTLIHEMLHVIVFFYNKNLNRENDAAGSPEDAMSAIRRKHLDWYVEGLARYFETFVGARHDFYSQGFKETVGNKIRFSRGGSNYFMRYPDQAFTQLRYENALFWRYMDYRFGMKSIEALSRVFRNQPNDNFESALEKATQIPFKEILKKFSLAILYKDFGLKEDTKFLKEVARTHLLLTEDTLYLVDGYENKQLLGSICRTDWVGSWDSAKAHFGEATVAGDNTTESDVSGWATDYYQIDVAPDIERLPALEVKHEKGGEEGLCIQISLETAGGSVLSKEFDEVPAGKLRRADLEEMIEKEGLKAGDIKKIYVLITNLDPEATADYNLAVSI